MPASRKRPRRKKVGSDLHGVMLKAALVLIGIYIAIRVLAAYGGLFVVLLFAAIAVVAGVAITRIQRARRRSQLLLTLGASNPMQLSPQQYERFCGLLLEQGGWNVSYTQAKGDQGADIIAERNGQRTVLQCKQWSSSVGSKAVQEVHAARSFYRAGNAIVVSTATYTSGAKELAKSTGVSLLNHKDLQTI